ncbi:dihydroorotate dehydrogenase (quinone) [Thermopolyspora flexuosa]|jgi:dihydroorotate dehydrogenase|uniref:Dihydroorotate dehydrogenase (quinone) n=1 Tax=Thermopolyspora flexuosa TaxID=103836 RepID=A0A543IQF9_9ACTN|nr:quinone-dependent dihydroorotate dehydrogenase [Thermopolyspora flexuosa]TQM72800.1 dihydroorotate oxidase A [Thermopolyspora flexuosa]GGM95040.1 dihydroorotate dehydrogenase (quinone) [Thermopolyspora flexuosa]
MYRVVFSQVLQRLDAEDAHRATVRALAAISRVRPLNRAIHRRLAPHDPALRVSAFGVHFPSPFGLAAGFDKNAVCFEALAAFGFGHVEVGTVTAHAQPGNARPRLFRLPAQRAVINRMGFNNDGAAKVARRLARVRGVPVVVGVNIGKTKVVPESRAVADYVASARALADRADYLVVNVSSPNTPGLRDLQAVERLRPLLTAVREVTESLPRRTPLLVKIAPDLADEDVDAVADLAVELGLDGIIATNTTIRRDGVPSTEAGGLSGRPLKERSLEVLRRLYARVGDRLTLVSVGGVEDVDDVWERLLAGATLVQGYTAMVYEGPLWAARINRALSRRLRLHGHSSIQEVIGKTAPARTGRDA